MKRIIPFLMNRSFFTKIYISICISSFIGIFFVTIIYHNHSQKTLIDMELKRVQQSITQASLNLDNQLMRITNDMIYYLVYSDNWSQLLKADTAEEFISEDMSRDLESFRLRYSGELESVFFLRKDRLTGREVFFHNDNLNRISKINYHEHEWYQNFTEKIENPTWTQPTGQHLFYEDRSQRTMWLTMGNYDTEDHDGIFVIRINSNIFGDVFERLADSDLMIKVKNSNDDLVYSTAAYKKDPNWLQIESKLENTDFIIHVYINKLAIAEKVRSIQSVHFIVLPIVIVIIFAFSWILSLTLVRPVREMLNLMQKVEKGNFDVRFPSKYLDEVGMLGKGFNKMIANVSNLIQEVFIIRMEKMESELKQKESTIMAMQNQINPHFLYNTLEAINCHAIINNVPSISHMSKAMADFFRYSIDNQEILTTLEREINHVKTYLEIQHERYPDIEIDISTPNEHLNYAVIKLTLQPIIENAYQHAFIGERDYYLKIYTEDVDESMYAVYVEDNGEGMDVKRLTEINKQFNPLSPNNKDIYIDLKDDSSVGRGIGLVNVHSRVRLRYGMPFGVYLLDSNSGGLLVRVLLPKEG